MSITSGADSGLRSGFTTTSGSFCSSLGIIGRVSGRLRNSSSRFVLTCKHSILKYLLIFFKYIYWQALDSILLLLLTEISRDKTLVLKVLDEHPTKNAIKLIKEESHQG